MLTLISGTMTPTLTYAKRSFAWVSHGTGFVTYTRTKPDGEVIEEVVPALGKVSVKLQPASTGWGRKIEVDTYAVQEMEPDYPGTRRFAFLNLTDPEQGEPYLVTVGGLNRCRCMAGRCGVESGCKHRDTVHRLIEEGALDPTGELLNV